MILAQRRRHLRIWLALAALLPLGLAAALLARAGPAPAQPPPAAAPESPAKAAP